MKKRLIALLGAALLVTGAAAVDAQRPGRFAGPGPIAIFEELNLTDAQKTQLQEMHQQLREEMQKLWTSGERPDPGAMQKLRAEHMEKLSSILTDDQKVRLEELRAQRGNQWWGNRGRMRDDRGGWQQGPGRMGRHARGGRGAWGPMQGPAMRQRADLFAGLKLTEEQKAKLQELRGEQREAMQKLRDEQRGEVQKALVKNREAMEKILTKEQRKQLEQLKDDAFYGGPKAGKRGWKRASR